MCKNVSKLLSIVLALALVVTMLAVPAHAEETAADYVAEVGGVQYETLAAAIEKANGQTVTLLKDTAGSGVVINKDVTIDFGGHTYTFTEPAVGSSGTESNGFQILSGNTVTLQNGTLTVDSAHASKYYILVQNYANLTVSNMNLDGTNLDKWSGTDGDSYVLSNNCGTVTINGNTSITANNDGSLAYTVDSCLKSGYTAPTVTIDTTGTINGKVEVSGGTMIVNNGTFHARKIGGAYTDTDVFVVSSGLLTINGATVNGGDMEDTTVVWAHTSGKAVINGGTFTLSGKNVSSGHNDMIYAGKINSGSGAVIEVNGGNFSATDVNNPGTNDANVWLLNEKDGQGNMTVTGGVYENFNPGAVYTEPTQPTSFLADGYCVGIDNTTYTVDEHKLTAVEAKPATCDKDGVNAHYTCENCGKLYNDAAGKSEITKQQATALAPGHKLTKVAAVEPTCTKTGMPAYEYCNVCEKGFISAVTGNGETIKVEFDPANVPEEIIIPANGHELTKVPAKEVTCTVDGNIEHYACSVCKGLFVDAEGKTGVSTPVVSAVGHQLTKVPAKEVTCTVDGNIEHYACSVCKGLFVDAEGKTGVSTPVVSAVGHQLTKTAAVAATCTTAGNIEYYTCSVCKGLFTDAEGKTATTAEKVVVAATGHTLKKVEATAPTYTADGNIEHYACACGALFADAEGKTATTAEAVILPQLIEIKESTADVSTGAVDTAIKEAETTGSVTIDLVEVAESETTTPDSGSDSETETKPAPVVSSAALPVESLEKVSKISEEATLTVNMTEVTVTMDSKTMAAVAEQSAGETVTLKVEKVETKTLTEKQQAAVENKEVAVVITATMISNDTAISDFKGGNVTIAVPFTLPEGTKGEDFQVYYVDDEGNMTAHDTEYKNGCLVFSTSHFSDYVVVNTADPTVPKTGDSANLLLHTSVMVIALAGLTALFIGKKKFSF